ncbi:heptaprenyl diphosphate synthase component 1 [Paenibacillus mucilaginosus]|uniref:Heptaprenyl diphosphate synthase component I n=2 Tax=Paenibacillus mucilaginosus TaxID=61624 RepID=H6NAG5_9BACL|nr:heptaprenyl diphosphate synthase component 1 [Paenibacillus mucilaginosus]AEI41340.1 heptaprenyl diphosphate synthase component I [Paenibacillus mucilaginosus KNP414]AFC29890.1 heptaprenyl diphosphate synthase component I [Paenibacillus mucilaginosus 3016]MCG7211239.1 heptaprenyl diphosphate synthase component 1 [Paenibacillus mucilaginosus]WDM30367.1 heptaprenyl diphosphate synthase component 1 [Paenibacillus mucilaginosus]WFA18552.1 heptaprenyl diphosphate synthase [Paenibacillus mucilagi
MTTYRIPEIAQRYLAYDMIQKHTDLPLFPDYRTRLLYAFLNNHSVLAGYSELYSLVTSLVQVGLDTHDGVSVNSDIKEQKAARSRQLKVLAGDYFSSRFYHLLAQAGRIDLVGVLSEAICEANRLKMNLYLAMKGAGLTAEEYLRQTVNVKAELYLSFGRLLEEKAGTVWSLLLRLITRCEVLLQEIQRSESSQHYRDSWGFWHVRQFGSKEEQTLLRQEEPDGSKLRAVWLKHKVTSQLYGQLEACMKDVHAAVQGLESEALRQELLSIGEPIRRYLSAPRATQEV